MKQSRHVAVLVLVVTAVVVMLWGGTTARPLGQAESETDPAGREIAALPTTYPDEIDPLAPSLTPTVEQVISPTATVAPTVAATVFPTQEPTAAPVETPRPPVPENPYDQSYIVERGESGRLEVALTFDAGEGPGYTTEILDFLAANDLKASFGITGEWARAYPELVQRMVDEGHMLFNHSESHLSWTGASTTGVPLTTEERRAELAGAETAVDTETGYALAPFYRPPYGDYDLDGLRLLKDEGYEYTLWWTCDSLGWSDTTVDEIVERCAPDAAGGGPGAIILMHVTQEDDYLALEGLVAAYEAAGYDFVTMEEMIQP